MSIDPRETARQDDVERVAMALALHHAGKTYSREHVETVWMRKNNPTFRDQARVAIAALPAPEVPSDIREAPVFAFLLGEGPLEGYWFGEHRPSGKRYPANFWWRKHLRAARASSPPGDGKLREALEKAIKSANERMPGISVPASNGDNLAIALCTYFDDGEDPEDEETHWSKAAIEGQEQMVEAIRNHYAEAVRAALSIREAGEGK